MFGTSGLSEHDANSLNFLKWRIITFSLFIFFISHHAGSMHSDILALDAIPDAPWDLVTRLYRTRNFQLALHHSNSKKFLKN